MKSLLALSALFLFVSCSRVDTGEGGIVRSFSGKIQPELETQGFTITILSKLEPIDLTQNIVNLNNVTARDSDNIPLSELDAKVTFNTNPDKAVEFYKKTRSITEIKDENGDTNHVLGYAIVQNQAVNELQKIIAKYKSKDITSNRTQIELDLKNTLQTELNNRFGNIFNVVNTNINTIKLDAGIERSLQMIQITRNQQLEIKAQQEQIEMRKQLLDSEMKVKSEVATRYGISMRDYLDLEIRRDFNKALEKSGANLQLHLNK